MASLNKILSAQAQLLVLDAASSRIQAGLLEPNVAARWETSGEDAGVGVFRCVEALGVDLDLVRAFAFCSGPGSILGIRTVAMALRAWEAAHCDAAGQAVCRPFYAYASLALVAHALGQPNLTLIADARRDSWHTYRLGGELRRMCTSELPANLKMPEGFRHWSALPMEAVARAPYLLSSMLARPEVADADLFRPCEAPDAFFHEEPLYAVWTPQLHRAS